MTLGMCVCETVMIEKVSRGIVVLEGGAESKNMVLV